MAAHDYNIANQSFPSFRSDLNSALSAILTNNSSSSAPTTTAAYMDWVDTTNSVVKRRNSADSGWFITDTADSDRVVTKTSNYTLTLADYGKTILVDASSNTVTITLLAAATADDNWFCTIKRIDNSGYAVTIDGNGSETIDGDLTILLDQNQSVTVISDASNYRTKQNSTLNQRRKNLVIGSNFSTNPWQRGTTFSSASDGLYSADRFVWSKTGVGVVDLIKTSDAPTVSQAGILTNHCLHVDVTTVDASIAASDFYRIIYKMEGYDFLQIAQRAFTLSFWVKSTKTGTFTVGFINSGQDRSFVAEYTISASDTWEKKIIVVLPSPSGGTWDYINGTGIQISFNLATGSTYQTTAGAWQSGQYYGTSNQVNALDSTSNNFKLALVQLEAGNVATPFEHRTIKEELSLCQRYYSKTYNLSDAPGASATTGALGRIATNNTTLGSVNFEYRFPISMRTTPTVAVYSTRCKCEY
jgi:hypothetical protein